MEAEGLHIPSGFKRIVDMTQQRKEEGDDNTDEQTITSQESVLIDQANNEMERYGTEWRSLQTRKTYAMFEIDRLDKKLDTLTSEISKLEVFIAQCIKFHSLTDEEEADPVQTLGRLTAILSTLQYQFIKHIRTFNLDHLAVATLQPILESAFKVWDPLRSPAQFKETFLELKPIFAAPQLPNRLEVHEGILQNDDDDFYSEILGSTTKSQHHEGSDDEMPLYERLFYAVWVPKIQHTLQDEWVPEHASTAILLLEEWSTVLPSSVQQYMYTSVIVPRLLHAVKKWKPSSYLSSSSSRKKSKGSPPPHTWLLPWFNYLPQESIVELVYEVKLRYSHLVKDWRPSDAAPMEGLAAWSEIMKDSEYEQLIEGNVTPRLAKVVKSYVKIKYVPTSAKSISGSSSGGGLTAAETLSVISQWCPSVVKPSVFGDLLVREFFGHFEEYLYDWIMDTQELAAMKNTTEEDQAAADRKELGSILSWYEAWYKAFPGHVSEIPAVARELHVCVDTIDSAVDIAPQFRSTRLAKPPLIDSEQRSSWLSEATHVRAEKYLADLGNQLKHTDIGKDSETKKKKKISVSRPSSEPGTPIPSTSTSFKDVVEDACGSNDLFLSAARGAHPVLGHPLYRVSDNPMGTAGMPVYMSKDVLWAKVPSAKGNKNDEYEPISLSELAQAYQQYKNK